MRVYNRATGLHVYKLNNWTVRLIPSGAIGVWYDLTLYIGDSMKTWYDLTLYIGDSMKTEWFSN